MADEEELDTIRDEDLAKMSVIVPLYREETVIPQIIKAMSSIDYPSNKLEIIITLEEYDKETITALQKEDLPKNFKLIYLPNIKPKTKPKALNVAFKHLSGEYVVIYDAEIVPEPLQLKKAFVVFKHHPDVACLQTRLDHYNAEKNIITKLFNTEFSFYYDLFLPGLHKIGFPIPVSGHSVIFRKNVLERIGAWDPYNVTEDCDAGIRLYRYGYKIALLDSISTEEATGGIVAWMRQRARWMKGFIQTSIVHLRKPLLFKKELGSWRTFFGFLLIVPGTVFLNILNLLYLFFLLAWLFTRSEYIQSLFPGPILYISVGSFILGNAIFIYFNLIGAYLRNRYALVKYSLLSPFYWILLSVATVYGMFELLFRPHHWQKTPHGKSVLST